MEKRGLNKSIATNIILLVMIVAAVFSFDPVLKIVTGCTRTIVKGTSMLPNLREGDLVFIKEVDASSIGLDDIIVFDKYVLVPGDPNIRNILRDPPWIHRVVEILHHDSSIYLKTMGDNNDPVKDPGWIPAEIVIGKLVFSIPLLGFLSINPLLRSLTILAILVLIFMIFYTELKGQPVKKLGNSGEDSLDSGVGQEFSLCILARSQLQTDDGNRLKN